MTNSNGPTSKMKVFAVENIPVQILRDRAEVGKVQGDVDLSNQAGVGLIDPRPRLRSKLPNNLINSGNDARCKNVRPQNGHQKRATKDASCRRKQATVIAPRFDVFNKGFLQAIGAMYLYIYISGFCFLHSLFK